jgi:hypothetical protein
MQESVKIHMPGRLSVFQYHIRLSISVFVVKWHPIGTLSYMLELGGFLKSAIDTIKANKKFTVKYCSTPVNYFESGILLSFLELYSTLLHLSPLRATGSEDAGIEPRQYRSMPDLNPGNY